MPAIAPSASSRAGSSPAPLACTVPHPPSCPVLSAASRSATSAPRTSPITSRSGRIRSACRTRSRIETAPAPSTFGGRASNRTTWGCTGRSSPASSTNTIRSPGSTSPSSAASRVVLPVPVPPVTKKASRAATSAAISRTPSEGSAPRSANSASEYAVGRSTRSDRHVPRGAIGGNTACSRVPSASRASTHGWASSRRRPAALASRVANSRSAASSPKPTPARTSPAPRSTHTSSGAFTRMSVTRSSRSNGSNGPAPASSDCTRRNTASRSASPAQPPSS